MKKFILFLFLIAPILLLSQWNYNSGTNKFDGDYKIATVVGKGGEWPYTKPTLVINQFEEGGLNIYLTNIGYTGCNRNTIRIAFNDSEDILVCDNPTTNNDKDAIFINFFNNYSVFDFLELLKVKNKVFIRFSNSCGMDDFEFGLSGSTKAINYVIGDLYEEIDEEEEEEEEFSYQYTSFLENFKCGDIMNSQRHSFVLGATKNIPEIRINDESCDIEAGYNLQFFNIYVDRKIFVKIHNRGRVIIEGFIHQEDCLRFSDDKRLSIMIKYLEEIDEKRQGCK